ncbi:MAG: hypothetical protein QXT77_09585 [Candidatus Methanomethylicaceae archaeon]
MVCWREVGRRERHRAAGCGRNGQPGPERVAGGVSGGRADEGVGEGKQVLWAGSPLEGSVETLLARGRWPEAGRRERWFSLGGRLAGRAVAGRERFACSCCWLVGRDAAQPAD